MATLYYVNQYITTQLSVSGGISSTDTANITLQDDTGLDTTNPGIALLDYQDPLDITKAEWITYTSINASKVFQGVTRGAEGSIARVHSDGCAIAFPISKSHINNINNAIDPTLNTYGLHNNSLSRQAIINGNFDVWQRGTSIAMTTANAYSADRWYCETATAGTDKTISRQDGTGVNGSYYCARVAMVQDVDELLTFSQALESQDSIKFRGQKVTLSFYARGGAEFVADNATLVSKIVTGKGTDQKVLAFTTSADGVSKNNTLTTGWQKFTCTTTAAIASDITQIGISFAFTHAGSGTTTNYFEVTQVQLCAGDVALPFMPKSFEEELRACMRYYEKNYPYAATPGSTNYSNGDVWASYVDDLNNALFYQGLSANTKRKHCFKNFRVKKRTAGTVRYWDGVGNLSKISSANDELVGDSNNIFETYQGVIAGEDVIMLQTAANVVSFMANWEVSAEL
jgi:hypothetical protein